MKRIILTIACALVTPFAFAQTSTTTTEKSTTVNPTTSTTETTTTTTSSSGTVSTFTPGKTIIVKTEAADPVTYSLGKTVHYVNKAGHEIKEHMIRPGSRVHVYYSGTGNTQVVERVVVDDD
jgi:hypothetical protein